LNNTLLNDQWVTEKIREENLKTLESSKNENRAYKNLWDSGKAVLRAKLITMSGYT
jgi:hypothetical protein